MEMISTNSERVDEQVKVVTAFTSKPTPLLLEWRGRRIAVKRVNLYFQKKVGQRLFYYFYVSDTSDNGYKLCFDTESLNWRLEEVTS